MGVGFLGEPSRQGSLSFRGWFLEPPQLVAIGFALTAWISGCIAFMADTLLFYHTQAAVESFLRPLALPMLVAGSSLLMFPLTFPLVSRLAMRKLVRRHRVLMRWLLRTRPWAW